MVGVSLRSLLQPQAPACADDDRGHPRRVFRRRHVHPHRHDQRDVHEHLRDGERRRRGHRPRTSDRGTVRGHRRWAEPSGAHVAARDGPRGPRRQGCRRQPLSRGSDAHRCTTASRSVATVRRRSARTGSPTAASHRIDSAAATPPEAPDDVVVDAGTGREEPPRRSGSRSRSCFRAASRSTSRSPGSPGTGAPNNLAGATIALFTEATAERVLEGQNKYDSILVSAQSGVTDVVLRERIALGAAELRRGGDRPAGGAARGAEHRVHDQHVHRHTAARLRVLHLPLRRHLPHHQHLQHPRSRSAPA